MSLTKIYCKFEKNHEKRPVFTVGCIPGEFYGLVLGNVGVL